jgi:FdhD protein
MVQKAATAGAPVVVAVSAPTGLALKVAEVAGITLVAVARKDGFEIFTHPRRIRGAAAVTPPTKEQANHAA